MVRTWGENFYKKKSLQWANDYIFKFWVFIILVTFIFIMYCSRSMNKVISY
jgi:hypothetical protein